MPVASKRPDDVLGALEVGWTCWAGPMEQLICDFGGEFERELGDWMEAHAVHQRHTAVEAPWQNGI
eukprot:3457835-Lingulodinium_polyedra.AAC.1